MNWYQEPCQSTDHDSKKSDNPAKPKRLDAITTSFNQLGDTNKKASEVRTELGFIVFSYLGDTN